MTWDLATHLLMDQMFGEPQHERAMGTFNFGIALERLKQGKRVARAGWHDGRYLCFQKGYPSGIPINKNTAEATGLPEGTVAYFTPYIMLKTADDWFTPWSASNADLISDDWVEVA